MEPSYLMVLGFSAWMFILVLAIGFLRVTTVLAGKHRVNTFLPSGEDLSPFAQRLCRAHANCYENLPIVIAVVFVAAMTHQLDVINWLAAPFLIFRILQSITHVISIRSRAVIMRFIFFLLQCVILIYWFIALIPWH